ncbi:hypothetical protein [Nocardia sp. NPDC050406]|uniref:hypothetical protein n=1 Tax=Nocardia sp. NPDC050406 TaxID=3364318 RepID=UPI0037A67ED2
MRKHRSSSRIRGTALVVGQVLGVAAAAAVAAGPALAEPTSRDDRSPSRPSSYQGDTTGAHAIDPFGYQHRDWNALRQNDHRNALRDYHARPAPQSRPDTSGRGGTATWTPTPSADGTGWAVCRPQASWC